MGDFTPMNEIPKGSPDYQRRNPHLFGRLPNFIVQGTFSPPTKPRIRQSQKPLLNKLETDLYDYLQAQTLQTVFPQALTFRLANGVRYSPDFFCFSFPWRGDMKPTAWECKGPFFRDDAVVKLKMFATLYPQILVLLASKNDGQWIFQEVFA